MTASARIALINIGTRRQGATLTGVDVTTLDELRRLGLVGRNGGLTRKGSIKRELIVEEMYDEMF